MKKLGQIPVPVAIGIMVLCIVAGVAFGNHNALSEAKAAPEAILQEVSELASERAAKGKNLLVVAGRNDVDVGLKTALEDAIANLEDATRATKIAEANHALTFAADEVNAQIQAVAGEVDRTHATGVMDDLYSYGKIMERRANAYNESLDAVRRVYNTLPMRWLIGGMPEVYQ